VVPKIKTLMVVSSVPQVEMMKLIVDKLPNSDCQFINTHRWLNRKKIEKALQDTSRPWETISFCCASAASRIIKREKPSVIVLGHDQNPMDKIFIRLANKMHIPSVLVQDGIIFDSVAPVTYIKPFRERLLDFIRNPAYSWRDRLEVIIFELFYSLPMRGGFWGHGECSRIAVFGKVTRDALAEEGVEKEHIIITGSPKFDIIHWYKDYNYRNKWCSVWGIPQGNRIVCLFTDYFVEAGVWTEQQRSQFVRSVYDAIIKQGNTSLIIKLHPTLECESDYVELFYGYAQRPIIVADIPVYEIAHLCDAAITVSSTVALEAMAAGKPFIAINLYKQYTPYLSSPALYVDKVEDIEPAIRRALFDCGWRKDRERELESYLQDHIYIQDGKASQRIAEVIKQAVAAAGIRDKEKDTK